MTKFNQIFGIVLLIPCLSFALSWPAGIQGDIKFESSDFILKSSNRNPGGAALDLNVNGAYGEKNKAYDNAKTGPWFVDYQKACADAVISGIYKNDEIAIERGLKILRWGLDQQKADGSYTSEDVYHNSLLFIEAASRSILHLTNSKYRDKFATQIDGSKMKIEKSIDWLIKPEVEAPGLKKDDPYTHRFYINAAAIGISGVLLGRKDFVEHSKKLIRVGISKQNTDGSNSEKNGVDTSYHSLGLLMAARYYSIVADDALRKPLYSMGEKGSQWLGNKVLENGDVDSSTNTRTGQHGEKRHGTELKSVTYFTIYKALAYWGQLAEKKDLILKSEKVFKFDREKKQ